LFVPGGGHHFNEFPFSENVCIRREQRGTAIEICIEVSAVGVLQGFEHIAMGREYG
jgi:hypothetical protein